MKTKITPTIVLDGKTYTPKGYEWVLGFALGGCQWAIEEACTEKFRNIVREDLKNAQNAQNERTLIMIKRYENEILKLKGGLL